MGKHIHETFYEQLNFFILCEFLRKEKVKKAEFQPIKFLRSANLRGSLQYLVFPNLEKTLTDIAVYKIQCGECGGVTLLWCAVSKDIKKIANL